MGWQLAGGELVSVALAAMQELQAQKKGDSEEPPLWVGGLVLLDLIESSSTNMQSRLSQFPVSIHHHIARAIGCG
jgi:hypothetical protein